MRTLLHNVASCSPSDCWGITRAYLYLLRSGWLIFIRKGRLDPWLIRAPTHTDGEPLTDDQRNLIRRRARWVNAAARHPFPWALCLQRSLALCLWLERLGFAPELRIGVQRVGAGLKAHAWVEYRDQVINDSPRVKERFTTLHNDRARLPQMGRH